MFAVLDFVIFESCLVYHIPYGYDKVENRIRMTKDGVTTSYKYNELNQLTSSVESKYGKET